MRLRYILTEVFRGLIRNRTMAVSIALVTFVSLAFVGSGMLVQRQISLLKGEWYGLVEVSVFLCPANSMVPACAIGEATEQQITEIRQFLATELGSRIESVTFETKAEALTAFEQHTPQGYQGIQLTENDMQASFRIKLTDPSDYQVVSEVLVGRPGVEDVIDQRAIFQPLFTALNRFSILAAGLAGVMLFTASLLISTTIRLSAMSRKKETGIMRLVGASNWVVRLPFILEGIFAAIVGSGLAVIGLWFVAKVLIADWLQSSVAWLAYVGTADVVAIAPVLLGTALLLAAIASAMTIRRYTKV